VAKLPPLGPSDESIAITYLHRNKPNSLHMFQPFQFVGNAWNEGGWLLPPKSRRGVYGQR
jgi:hypothetical protein